MELCGGYIPWVTEETCPFFFPRFFFLFSFPFFFFVSFCFFLLHFYFLSKKKSVEGNREKALDSQTYLCGKKDPPFAISSASTSSPSIPLFYSLIPIVLRILFSMVRRLFLLLYLFCNFLFLSLPNHTSLPNSFFFYISVAVSCVQMLFFFHFLRASW